jgi:hypothetical protein
MDIEVTALPRPLRSINGATVESIEGDALILRAGAGTDWFRDPGGDVVVHSAPALVMPVTGSWMLQARTSAAHLAAFDAAVLTVYVDERTWAKLCLELSPQGVVMVVSVVTRGESDDCNSVPIEGDETRLRIARLGTAFAFHYSPDGETWRMVRYFTLGEVPEVEVGFLSQSPTGDGCVATFNDIAFVEECLADVRSGI